MAVRNVKVQIEATFRYATSRCVSFYFKYLNNTKKERILNIYHIRHIQENMLVCMFVYASLFENTPILHLWLVEKDKIVDVCLFFRNARMK